MRRTILQSLAIAVAVAFASRYAEWTARKVAPAASDFAHNLVGMTIAGVVAGLLFFLWRYQQRERIRLLRERERVVRHVHHHIRNSLQVIVNRHPSDPLVIKHVDHILKELTYALPGRGKSMPEAKPGESQKLV